jgi:hypothetical protein
MDMCQDCLRDAPYSRPHKIQDCLTKASAFCTHCCKSGHFSVDCQFHCNALETSEKVDSPRMAMQQTPHRIPKETRAIRAFCTINSLSVLQDMKKNVKTIEKFCAENKVRFTWVEIPAEVGEVAKPKTKSRKKVGDAKKNATTKEKGEEGV